MLSIALHTLRARWTSFIGSFLAMATGVALLTVMGQALAASLDAPARSPERLAAAPVVVRGQDTLRVPTPNGDRTAKLPQPRPIPPATITALRTLGPVTEDRTFPVRAPGTPVGLVGHPWSTARFAPYDLTTGRPPATAAEVVTTGDWADVGGRLSTDRGTVTVVGTVRDLGFEDVVFYTDARAAQLSPDVRQSVLEADAAKVADRIRAQARVLTGDARRYADPDRDTESLTALNALFGTAGGVTAFVSILVVASTFAFAVAQRRREFGLLRTAGATPGQIRRTVLAESLLVGVLASAAGCALGSYAAPHLTAAVVDGGLAPAWYRIGGHSWPYHLAFWTGLLVALSGATAASWRAGRTAPVQALRETSADADALPWGCRLCGAALLATAATALAYTLLTNPGDLLHRKTYISRPMLLIGAVALLSPVLVRPLLRLLVGWPAAWLPGAVGLLVRQNAVANVRRTAAVAAPVLASVALAGCLLGGPATLNEARAAEVGRQTAADFVVTGADGTTVEATALARLRRTPGVEVVSASSATTVYALEDGVALVKSGARTVDPALLARTMRLPVTAGRSADLDDDSIIVNEEWARHRVGQRVRVRLGDGTPRTLRVAAVLAVGTGGNGVYVTPANAPGARVDRVDVRTRSDADVSAVAVRLRAVDGVRVMDKEQWIRASYPETNRTTRLGVLLVLGIALAYTALSLANTLLMATTDRKRELTFLRLVGATRSQVLRVAAAEALTVVAVGDVLGLLVTAIHLHSMGAALRLLSAPAPVVIPWTALGWTTGACALLALVATLTPTALTLRRGPETRSGVRE